MASQAWPVKGERWKETVKGERWKETQTTPISAMPVNGFGIDHEIDSNATVSNFSRTPDKPAFAAE